MPALVAALIVLAACKAAPTPLPQPTATPRPTATAAPAATPTPTPAPTPTPLAAPELTITSPADGSFLLAGDVTVAVQVSNFNIVDRGLAKVAGEGHIHYYLDVATPTTPGQPAVTAPGTYAMSTATSYTWKNVPPGAHTFRAQLVYNDHTPLIPLVTAKVTVSVLYPPTINIAAPTDGSTMPVGDVTVKVQVSSFNLVDKLGQPNVLGQGHIHYYLDVEAPTKVGQPAVTAPGTYAPSTATSYMWTGVAPGSHTLSAQLVNNDHTPLIPLVVAEVVVVASATGGRSS